MTRDPAPSTTACTACGKPRPQGPMRCAHCGAEAGARQPEKPAYMNMSAEQVARARVEAPRDAPRLALRHDPIIATRWHPYIQSLLLFLSVPILAPALLWLWITAKRWGRVSTALVAAPGFVLLLLTWPSPLLAAIAVVANVAMAVLFVWRYRLLEQGVVLGYSNLVAMPIIVGGSMFLFGACAIVPRSMLNPTGMSATATPTTVREIVNERIARPKHVTLRSAELDLRRRVVRRGGRFAVASAQGTGESPTETWAPFTGARDRLWLVQPGAPAAPSDRIDGMLVETDPEERAGIEAALASEIAAEARGNVARFAVVTGSEEQVHRRLGRDASDEGVRWSWSWLVVLGIAILSVGIVRSVYEA